MSIHHGGTEDTELNSEKKAERFPGVFLRETSVSSVSPW